MRALRKTRQQFQSQTFTPENYVLLHIKVLRKLRPQVEALYPVWQGMQYFHDMFSGCAKLEPLDNARYPGMQWTTVRQFLAKNDGR